MKSNFSSHHISGDLIFVAFCVTFFLTNKSHFLPWQNNLKYIFWWLVLILQLSKKQRLQQCTQLGQETVKIICELEALFRLAKRDEPPAEASPSGHRFRASNLYGGLAADRQQACAITATTTTPSRRRMKPKGKFQKVHTL